MYVLTCGINFVEWLCYVIGGSFFFSDDDTAAMENF
jgi:hypothetical protein